MNFTHTPQRLRPGRGLLALAVIAFLYVAALVAVDSRDAVFGRIAEAGRGLAVLAVLSFVSFHLRFVRWKWLLARTGHAMPWGFGFAAYLSGFAFTATPGKVGELARIRYHSALGIPPSRVLAVFVYERAADLLVVLALAALAVREPLVLLLIAGFVAGVFVALAVVLVRPRAYLRGAAWLRRRGWRTTARIAHVLARGLAGVRVWLTPRDVLLALALGALAWSLPAYGLVWLLQDWGVPAPALAVFSVYPAAMLAGAASFLPGGVGATEAAIVALLRVLEVPLGVATLAAVTCRVGSMWWSVVCGVVAIVWLEQRLARGPSRTD